MLSSYAYEEMASHAARMCVLAFEDATYASTRIELPRTCWHALDKISSHVEALLQLTPTTQWKSSKIMWHSALIDAYIDDYYRLRPNVPITSALRKDTSPRYLA